MNVRRFLCVLVLAAAALLHATGPNAQTAKKVALVIGNDAYESLPKLRNAVADSRSVRAALQELGFQVFGGEDLSFRRMNRVIAEFENAIGPGDTTFVFFAGHGVAFGSDNFLLPTDLEQPKAGEEGLVKSESQSADGLVRGVTDRGALSSFFVFDACRDNPFEAKGTRGVGGTRGLVRTDAPTGVFVLYSAGIGQTALDRLNDSDTKSESVFTRTFVPLLLTPGLNHLQVAKGVQTKVSELARSVGHQQQPAFYDQVIGEVVFKPGNGTAPTVQSLPLSQPEAPPKTSPQTAPPAQQASLPPVTAKPASKDLNSRFRDFMIGTWRIEIPHPENKTLQGTTIRYEANGRFSGQAFVKSTDPARPGERTIPLEGTWTARGVDEKRWSLNFKSSTGQTNSGFLTMIDQNSAKNETDNAIARRVR